MSYENGELVRTRADEEETRLSFDAALQIANEHWLIQDVQSGNPSAFEELYTLHADRARASVRRRLENDPITAEDVVQDAFLRIWRNMSGINNSYLGLGPYLNTTINNLVTDIHRQHTRRKTDPTDFHNLPEPRVRSRSTEDIAVGRLSAQAELKNAIATIDNPDRARSLFGSELLDSDAELSAITGVNIKTIRTQRTRARQTLNLPALRKVPLRNN